MITYTPILYNPFGERRAVFATFTTLDYVLNCTPGGVGELALELSPTAVDPSFLVQDARIGVWRSINGRAATLDGNALFLLQDVETSASGMTLAAMHANCLLHARTINYASDGVFVQRVAAPADNQIKAFARENLGALINGALRYGAETYADLSSYLSIAADLGLAPSIPVADVAQRYLDEVIRDLCQQSATAGTYLTAMVEAITPALLELRTYTGQRGVDRSRSSGQPLTLSEAKGSVENVKVKKSWRESASFIIAGGAGDGSGRAVATALDTARAGASPFGRRERFIESSDTADLAVLQQVANAELRRAREIITMEADLRESDTAMRGVQYDLGDILVVADARTRSEFDVRLDVVHVTVGNGQQRSQATLRSL